MGVCYLFMYLFHSPSGLLHIKHIFKNCVTGVKHVYTKIERVTKIN